MVRAFFVLWMLAFGVKVSSAQIHPDSVRALPEVEVVDSLRAQPPGGILVRYLDVRGMSAVGGRLDDLLESRSSAFIRRSGTTGLSTASMRGAGSLRTTILLDGHRLADPQTGTLDLSLIPGFLLSGVRVVHGPGLVGSADGRSLGGAIELETMGAGEASSGVRVGVFGGAFGRWAGGAGLRLGKGRWAVAGAAQLETLRGDHTYLDEVAFPSVERRREGAGRTLSSFLGSVGFDGESIDVDLLALATRAHRGVPGPVNAPPIAARQRDTLDRVQATVRTGIPGGSVALRAAATGSTLRFDHPTFGVARTHTRSWTGSLELKKAYLNYVLLSLSMGGTLDRARAENAGTQNQARAENAGTQNQERAGNAGTQNQERAENAGTQNQARSENAAPTHRRHQGYVTAGLLLDRHRWHSSIGATLEVVQYGESNLLRLTPAASFRFQPLSPRPVWLRTSASRILRVPTLGELHITPGGNPDLRAEDGYSLDAGVETAFRRSRIQVRADVGVFVNRLRNRILWRPSFVGAGIQVWRPSNIAQTATRGFEGEIRLIVIGGAPDRLEITLSGSHIQSVDRTDPDLVSFDRQLRYTPRTMLRMNTALERGAWRFEASVRRTGLQFTTSDESLHLGGHTSVDVSVERILGDRFTLWAAVENATDAHIEYIRFYPMPGRYFSAGLLLNTIR